WYPQKLEKQVQCFLEADDSIGLVYTWSVDIDDQGNLTGGYHARSLEGNALIALTYTNFLGHASVPLIRRCCFEKAGYYDPQLRAQNAEGCEDIDLYLRIAEYYQFRVVPEFLMEYRRTNGSMSCNWHRMLKSHLLVHEKIKQKYSLPQFVYRWSDSSHYLYVLYRCHLSNSHWEVLQWFAKLLLFDPVVTLHLGLLKLVFVSFLKLSFNLLSQKLFLSCKNWMSFKRDSKLAKARKKTIIEIEEMRRRTENIPWWQLRYYLLNRRWQVVKELSQKTVFNLNSAPNPSQISTQLGEKIL
ncbi:family 2 glycosyl transferase, partial [filamentous cyanobacterium CCP1]